MSKKSSVRRPARPEPSRPPIAASRPRGTKAAAPGGIAELIESASQEVLAATHWLDRTPGQQGGAFTIRFEGQRVAADGKREPRDQFVHDEPVSGLMPGEGPISVTARIRDVNPGEWAVSARVLTTDRRPRTFQRGGPAPAVDTLDPAGWPRRARSLYRASGGVAKTRLGPLARAPGIFFPGFWGVMVLLGVTLGLLAQSILVSREHVPIAHPLFASLVALLIGVIGAKVWFIALQWPRRRFEGWCIQGFMAGVAVSLTVILLLSNTPIGTFLDVSTPGLFIGLAVGRIGCFFAGCCGGRPTASRWGVWSSDQRIGVRRVPTQLLEFILAAAIAGAAWTVVVVVGPSARGTVFVGAIAAYTLVRQAILLLRVEGRHSRNGSRFVALAAAVALIIDLVLAVRLTG